VTIELVLPTEGQAIVTVNCSETVYGVQLVAMNEIVTSCMSCRYHLWNFTRIDNLIATQTDAERLARQGSAIPAWSALESILVVGEHRRINDLTDRYREHAERSPQRSFEHDLLTFRDLKEATGWIEARHGPYCSTTGARSGQSIGTSDKEKRIGIPPVPYDFEHYLNERQKATLTRFEQFGWDIAFVRRMGYTNPLVVISDASKKECVAIKRDGSVTRSIKLVLRDTDTISPH
jgi:hypothetical protein